MVGDDLDLLCKAVPSRKRAEVKKLWIQYQKAYPLDNKGKPIEFDDDSSEEEEESNSGSSEEEVEEEEEEEEEEEQPAPPKKQKIV